ncbi:hypothetical protein PUW24_09495 [Paenibacillus urinalis]|uniref:HTH merR-type domain-containing protein n=1 Tax=Paenibacillus urinalis TaxID=521520 RepID=A0AAX3N1T4_9BACL|nr:MULTISPECIES: hypothetical protein [Paenibacillus]WDH83029.1 hypothetical protein PUW23_01940 [Paenibacillus urinalis]WDH99083.1 hypothetical protein PUW24_09495 [Paenibacillus urinalis]WDI02774.1 hypothetical protein PUW25_01945 [Paenibacillus urinalis]GAK40266.1 hypothetical protein TCA2_2756 [Paenibacillus sp. TCA20]
MNMHLNMNEAGATTETAKELGIGASTLRKYAAALEEHGHRFERAANKSRLFGTLEIERIKEMMNLMREQNLPLNDAAVLVMELNHEMAAAAKDGSDIEQTSAHSPLIEQEKVLQKAGVEQEQVKQLNSEWQILQERMAELEREQTKLMKQNEQLQEQVEEQRLWIKEKLDEDRDRQLITNLRSYQGRNQKPKPKQRGHSLRMLFGLLPKSRREA